MIGTVKVECMHQHARRVSEFSSAVPWDVRA
jgi:hypothetical protein